MNEMKRAVVEIFGGCNLYCEMCPQSTGRGSNWTRKMPLTMFENILDQIPGKPVIQLEGSGEATLAKDLHMYVRACTDRGMKSFMFTNGMLFDRIQRAIDNGLSMVRFSINGHTEESYTKTMAGGDYNLVLKNLEKTVDHVYKSGANTQVSTYHLIIEGYDADDQIRNYIDLVEKFGIYGYIWRMHNWSGNRNDLKSRKGQIRSCGRPFAPELTVRAGGLDGRQAAVTPCCQTMGPPNEDKSVLGHLDTQTLEEVWNGDLYEDLRERHRTGDWPDYCKNCDFLIDDPEVLVWSNDPDAGVNRMLGTDLKLR